MDKGKKDSDNVNKALHRLIAQATQFISKEFVRPSAECIEAYLIGAATAEQNLEMWSALDRSRKFRQEILEMANVLELFASKETAEEAAKLNVGDMPKVISQLIEPEPPSSILEEIRDFVISPKVIRAVATAALVLIVPIYIVLRSGNDVPNWELVSKNVDPGLLISMMPRDASIQSSPMTYSIPDSAALAEFRSMLSFEGGEFKLVPKVELSLVEQLSRAALLKGIDNDDDLLREISTDFPTSVDTEVGEFDLEPEAERRVVEQLSRVVQLKIMDNDGDLIREISADIPTSDISVTKIEAWLLTLPNRTLYKVKMAKDTMAVAFDKKEVSKACVTFTYGESSRFKSTSGFVIKAEGLQ